MSLGTVLLLLLVIAWLVGFVYFVVALEQRRPWALELARLVALTEMHSNRYLWDDDRADQNANAVQHECRSDGTDAEQARSVLRHSSSAAAAAASRDSEVPDLMER
ncbi:MAG: hypothetical protein AAGG11_08740 [Pseudomonadota bacterium]